MSRQIRRLGLSKNVEIPILTTTVKSFRFSDSILSLDQVLIHAIFVQTNGVKSPEFRPLLPYFELTKGFITLAGYKNEQYNSRFPFKNFRTNLAPLLTTYGLDLMFIKPKLISLRHSSVDLPDIGSVVLPAEGYSISLTVFYDLFDEEKHKLNSWGELIEEPHTKK
jgi:hypothetical protein